jgi:3'(2'), 5'-bisphosphate nucleotidase
MDNNIERLKEIAIKAGMIVMSYYKKNLDIQIKNDNSPVTKADIESNSYIVDALHNLDPNIPIIAEENLDNNQVNINDRFWLVDPLDGTAGYIEQNDQFAINIALVNKHEPLLGIIYIPVLEELFYNIGPRAYKQVGNQITEIKTNKHYDRPIITASANATCLQTKDFIETLDPKEIINMSSAIKFCLIAEGKADIYPRFKRTMEWDSAAGHAIVNAAGGKILDASGSTLLYGKELFENKGFIVYGKK